MPKKIILKKKGGKEKNIFEDLLRYHPFPILIYDSKTLDFLYVNEAAIKKYGYSRSKFLKMNLKDLFPSEYIPYSLQKIKRANPQRHKIKSGKLIDVQVTFQTCKPEAYQHLVDLTGQTRLTNQRLTFDGHRAELMIVQDISEQVILNNKLANIEAELRTTLYSIGDAVISTDEHGKIVIMNLAAERLTGWKESEAKGKPLEKVFKIVNEYTRAKVENPVKKVLRQGIVVGLANHTLLIARDGTERPIMDCGAPIKDKSGKISGVVLVFRDQTKEREAQRKIEEAKIFAESVIATVREPLIVLDSKMRVITANRSFYQTFRTTPEKTIGQSLYKLGNRQWNIPKLKELLEKILPQNTSFDNFEVEYNFPQIGKRIMLLNARRIYRETNKTDMILLAIEDITEREEKKKKILENEKQYRLLFNSMIDAFAFHEIILDKKGKPYDYRFLEVNPTFEKFTGLKAEKLIGRTVREVLPNIESYWIETYGKVALTGESIHFENYSSDLNKYYEVVAYSPEPKRFVTIFRDVTDRKNAEQRIRKLNRVYAVLSEVNQAIVRIHDYEKLLNSVCQIAVEKGGFVMAWIGMIDSETNKVNVVASAGLTEDYLSKINIDLSDKKRSGGPTGTAIRTGEHVISNYIEKNNLMKPWREDAIKYGYKSSAAFPIKVFGKVVGTFNLYSAEIDFFDDEEIKLLDDLSMDLSFALEFIEQEKERKKVENLLRQNEQKYYSLIESSEDSIYLVDKDCKYLYLNNRYLSRIGLPLNEVIGKSYSEFHTAENSKEFEEKVKTVFETGKSLVYEYQSFRDNRYFIRTLSPVKDPNSNKPIAVTIISKDITDRINIEKTLRESEEKFRKLAESTNTAIFIYKGTKFVYANNATQRLSGYTEQELLNMNFWDVVHPEFRELIKERGLARQRGEEAPPSYEFKIITKDGQEKWINFTSTLIDFKGEIAALGTAFDITERKIAEQNLKESEERFRNIYESLTIGVYRTSLDGRLLMANPTFLSILGYNSLEEAKEKIIMDKVYAEEGTRDLFLKIILEEGIVYGFEQKWRRADGKIVYIRENARAYKDNNGNVAYFEGTIEDITTRKLAEEELIKAKEKAEQADKLKTNFLAQMSHEIRTPINVIVSFNNLIKDEVRDKIDPELYASFISVDLATKRIIRTIDLILNMSAIQSGTYEPTFKSINIKKDIIDNLILEYKLIAENKGLNFSVVYNTSLLDIYADEYSVTQIFSNLIDNAIKYTLKGLVEIIVDRDNESKLIVKVKDTGVGISEEFIPNLFKPFTQEEQGYTRRFEGSGLGLALVKKYCEINNAEISVESKKNEGSTFTVIFN